jgi:hypothetical protein
VEYHCRWVPQSIVDLGVTDGADQPGTGGFVSHCAHPDDAIVQVRNRISAMLLMDGI